MLKKEKVENLIKKVKREDKSGFKREKVNGYVLSVERHPTHLSLSGYIQREDNEPFDNFEQEVINEQFHGGISFKNKTNTKLGFSCTTAQDILPGMEQDLLTMGLEVEEDNSINRSYKSKQFVMKKLKQTVEQLVEENEKAWVF